MSRPISVVSDAARDLLQSAGMFKNEKLVVWEYVSNGLQYVDPGTRPRVEVVLDSRRKRIAVADNGRGMDLHGLGNFFVMHGENVDRQQGRPGRGLFGTGKSAAFGIADVLRVTSVRRGRRSRVELTRADVEASRSASGPVGSVPVRVLEAEVVSDQPNGTLVEIEGIHLPRLDVDAVHGYVERHLARWPRDVEVVVNGHVCEYVEPSVRSEHHFGPSPDERKVLGDVELLVKVAKAPLPEELRGVSVFASGVWHETTLAGVERKELGDRLCGESDIPALDRPHVLPAFDASRRQELNRSNPLVRVLIPFIGRSLEHVRSELVREARAERATQEARRLAEEARRIADVLNADCADWRAKIARVRAHRGGGPDPGGAAGQGAEPGDDLLVGGDQPAMPDPAGTGGAPGGAVTAEPSSQDREARPDPEGEPIGRPAGAGERPGRRGGGFSVEFAPLGRVERRARYVRDRRTILINLDHEQIRAARANRDVGDPVFRRLAYEVALTEYAFALAAELDERSYFGDTADALYEIRDTVDRVARRAAALYST